MPVINIRGTKRFYEDLNPDNRDVIVLVHGHPFDHTMWDYQLDALRSFRRILPDLRGYGQSEAGTGDIFIEEQAMDIALLLDHLNIQKVHLVGLSMGGQIIVEFARLFPARILSLVICDTSPAGETQTGLSNRMLLAESILHTGMEKHTIDTIAKYLHPHTIANNKKVYDHLYRMMTNTDAAAAAASHRGRAHRRNNIPYLGEISVPVLTIVGDSDAYTSVQEMREISGLFPQATFAVVTASGHMPNMEQPKDFNAMVLAFYHQHRIGVSGDGQTLQTNTGKLKK